MDNEKSCLKFFFSKEKRKNKLLKENCFTVEKKEKRNEEKSNQQQNKIFHALQTMRITFFLRIATAILCSECRFAFFHLSETVHQ